MCIVRWGCGFPSHYFSVCRQTVILRNVLLVAARPIWCTSVTSLLFQIAKDIKDTLGKKCNAIGLMSTELGRLMSALTLTSDVEWLQADTVKASHRIRWVSVPRDTAGMKHPLYVLRAEVMKVSSVGLWIAEWLRVVSVWEAGCRLQRGTHSAIDLRGASGDVSPLFTASGRHPGTHRNICDFLYELSPKLYIEPITS